MSTRGFSTSVNKFIRTATWLGPLDAPAVASLKVMARELDNADLTPALLSQFGLAYRSLLKRAPSEAPEGDEFERLLGEGRGA